MMEFRVLPVTVSDNANVIQCKNQRALLIFLFRTKMFLSTCSAPFFFVSNKMLSCGWDEIPGSQDSLGFCKNRLIPQLRLLASLVLPFNLGNKSCFDICINLGFMDWAHK